MVNPFRPDRKALPPAPSSLEIIKKTIKIAIIKSFKQSSKRMLMTVAIEMMRVLMLMLKMKMDLASQLMRMVIIKRE